MTKQRKTRSRANTIGDAQHPHTTQHIIQGNGKQHEMATLD